MSLCLDAALSCELQVLLLILLLLFFLFLGCWCVWRRKAVTPSQSCGELGHQSFTVLPKTLLQAKPTKVPDPEELVDPPGEEARSKVHVVWNVDMKSVQDWLAGRAAAPRFGQEGEPDADLEVALETGAQAPRRSSVSHPHGKKETPLFPAYCTGDRVEYFSTTQEKWLLGEVKVEQKGRLPVYSVTLHRLAQELQYVGQEMLRMPFAPGEPCELWSSSEKCWMEGEVLAMEAGSTPLRQYKVQLLGQLAEPFIVEASVLRRCFPEGSQVRVYQSATKGFCHARVVGPSEPCLDGPRGVLDFHVMVPILKASHESTTVPSYLLRFVPQHSDRRATTGGKWKKQLAAKIGRR